MSTVDLLRGGVYKGMYPVFAGTTQQSCPVRLAHHQEQQAASVGVRTAPRLQQLTQAAAARHRSSSSNYNCRIQQQRLHPRPTESTGSCMQHLHQTAARLQASQPAAARHRQRSRMAGPLVSCGRTRQGAAGKLCLQWAGLDDQHHCLPLMICSWTAI